MRQKKYILKQIAIICTAAFLFTGCGKADKSYDKGMEYIESEDYGKALKCFEEAISENADKAEYYIGAGMAYNYLGRYDEAVEKFSHAFQESENTISNTNNKQLYYGDAISKYGLAKYVPCNTFHRRKIKFFNCHYSTVLFDETLASALLSQIIGSDSLIFCIYASLHKPPSSPSRVHCTLSSLIICKKLLLK